MTKTLEKELRNHGMLLTKVQTWQTPYKNYWNLITQPGTDRKELAEQLTAKYPKYTFNPNGEAIINNGIYPCIDIFQK